MLAAQKHKIEQLIDQLLAEANIETTFPLPLEKIAKHVGFRCHFYIPDEDIADIVGTLSHAKQKFYINQNNTRLEQSIAIARLIGHAVLYGAAQDYICCSYPSSNSSIPKERELDYFALALLLPKALFEQKWHETRRDFSMLAQFFAVNRLMISARADNLKLQSIAI